MSKFKVGDTVFVFESGPYRYRGLGQILKIFTKNTSNMYEIRPLEDPSGSFLSEIIRSEDFLREPFQDEFIRKYL